MKNYFFSCIYKCQGKRAHLDPKKKQNVFDRAKEQQYGIVKLDLDRISKYRSATTKKPTYRGNNKKRQTRTKKSKKSRRRNRKSKRIYVSASGRRYAKCWSGYKRQGWKTKNGRRVPKCVKKKK